MAQTRFLGWTQDRATEAQAYLTAVNARSQADHGEQFAASWYPRQALGGLWIVPFYGPPARASDAGIAEPEEFPALREHAAFVPAAEIQWPEEEE